MTVQSTGRHDEGGSPVRVVTSATAAMTLAVMPAFLVGATAVQIRDDLHFDERALGLVVGLFFAATSLTSIPGGRLAERVGPWRGLLVSTVLGAASLLGIAILARSLVSLIVFAALGGVATGVTLPAASLALVRGAPFRPGLMFGLKQSAPPAASLLAGLAVPVISLQVGWRWAFVSATTLAAVALIALPSPRAFAGGGPRAPDDAARARIRREFAAVGVGISLASAVAISMGAFVVSSSVANGIPPGTAGVLLAIGSVVGVSSRLMVGVVADRHDRGHLHGVGAMVGLGALGYLGLASGTSVAVTGAGVVLGYGFGYGWSGLLFYAVSRLNPDAPALSVGIVNTGATAGAAIGPPAFGLLVSLTSFRTAWLAAAAISAVSCVLLLRSAGRIERGRLARDAIASP